MNKQVSFFRAEKYLLKEMTHQEISRFETEMVTDENLRIQIEAMNNFRSPLSWSKIQSKINDKPDSFFLKVGDWIEKYLPMPKQPALAWGGAFVFLALLIPAILIPLNSQNEIRSKGNAHPEIKIEIGESKIVSGETHHVKSGDVLNFSYRSASSLYTQIWYIEDNGNPTLFDGRSDISLKWPATSSWKNAPQRIRLDGNWKKQKIYILSSRSEISAEAARKIISENGKSNRKVDVFSYDLIQP